MKNKYYGKIDEKKQHFFFGIKQFSLHPKEIVLPSILVCPKILV
jgi:hypothetical protein